MSPPLPSNLRLSPGVPAHFELFVPISVYRPSVERLRQQAAAAEVLGPAPLGAGVAPLGAGEPRSAAQYSVSAARERRVSQFRAVEHSHGFAYFTWAVDRQQTGVGIAEVHFSVPDVRATCLCRDDGLLNDHE